MQLHRHCTLCDLARGITQQLPVLGLCPPAGPAAPSAAGLSVRLIAEYRVNRRRSSQLRLPIGSLSFGLLFAALRYVERLLSSIELQLDTELDHLSLIRY